MGDHSSAYFGGFDDDETLEYAGIGVAEGLGEGGVEGAEDCFAEGGHDAVDAAADSLDAFEGWDVGGECI